ncbi:MAG: uroporphyrinogen-III synthase [Pseudomonadota bacterium]
MVKATVLVTRPEPDAAAFAKTLREAGYAPISCPVMTIRTSDAPLPLDGVGALAFTSANGVRAFAARTAHRDFAVFAVGAVTADAARAAGFREVAAAGGDVDALAALIVEAASRRPLDGDLLHIAGAHRAGALSAALAAAGVSARRAALYEAVAADALPPETAALLKASPPDWATFFSPRTAKLFVSLVRDAGQAAALGHIRAAAFSENVASALENSGFRSVGAAVSPSVAAMIDLMDGKKR